MSTARPSSTGGLGGGWTQTSRTVTAGGSSSHPPGSPCSIIFGTGVTPSTPGTAQFLHLVVSDIQAARNELIGNGVDASEVFHDAGGGYNRFDADVRRAGPIRNGAATGRS
jgi:hypothetical protein